jgi:hypothetical protein
MNCWSTYLPLLFVIYFRSTPFLPICQNFSSKKLTPTLLTAFFNSATRLGCHQSINRSCSAISYGRWLPRDVVFSLAQLHRIKNASLENYESRLAVYGYRHRLKVTWLHFNNMISCPENFILSEFSTCYCSQQELSKIDNICCDFFLNAVKLKTKLEPVYKQHVVNYRPCFQYSDGLCKKGRDTCLRDDGFWIKLIAKMERGARWRSG